VTSASFASSAVCALAQDRLKTFPGYEQYERMVREIPTAVQPGAVSVTWTSDTTFEYSRAGKRYRFDVRARQAAEAPAQAEAPRRNPGQARLEQPERGRQFEIAKSPDGRFTAVYRDRNIYLTGADEAETAITTDGAASSRTKYGTASWASARRCGGRPTVAGLRTTASTNRRCRTST
jgi:dipeptidyl-peptidase-4